jgi:serine/threonine-protein kinase
MSEATLYERLRVSELLSPEQLAQLRRTPEAASADPRALGKLLVQRGWLTRFQVSMAAAGRAAELFVGPYVLLDRLGEGGMGQVFKARHRHMKRTVALKQIRKEKLANAAAVDRFYQEVQAAAQLTHPNIVLAFDAGQAGTTHFFAMEYVEGCDLKRLVREQGPLPVAQACEYVRQAALGLDHAHGRGLVHRDIKPANLLVTAGDAPVVKILDMGLARLGDSFAKDRDLTRLGQVLGTPDYLAPEQALDSRKVDIRADIYSLGCTLFFLLTGRTVFDAENVTEVLVKHHSEPPPALRSVRPDAPAALEALLARMLAKKPEHRPAVPAAVAAALEPFARGPASAKPVPVAVAGGNPGDTFAGLSTESGAASRPAPRGKRDRSRDAAGPVKRPRGKKALVLAAAGVGGVVLLALAALGGALLSGPAKQPLPERVAEKPGQAEKPQPAALKKPVEIGVVGGTAAPKTDPPAPPKGTTPAVPKVAVEADGPLFAAVEQAVRAGKTTKTVPPGDAAGEDFTDVPEAGAVLTGLVLGLGKSAGQEVVCAVRPIFRTRTGRILGGWYGEGQLREVTVEARQGYAVGGVTQTAQGGVGGLSLTFMAVKGAALDPSSSYVSDWVGGKGGRRASVGGDGAPVVGVFGKRPVDAPGALVALGLVTLRRATEAAPEPVVRDALSGTQIRTIKAEGRVMRGLLGPDGRTCVFVHGIQLAVADVRAGKLLRSHKHDTLFVALLAASGDRRLVVLADEKRRVSLWDAQTGFVRFLRADDYEVDYTSLAVSPDGTLAVGGPAAAPFKKGPQALGPDGKVLPPGVDLPLWDLKTGNRDHSFGGAEAGRASVVFTGDGRFVVTAGRRPALRVWDLKTKAEVNGGAAVAGLPPVARLAAAGKSEVLAACDDGSLWLWDCATMKRGKTFQGKAPSVNALAVAADRSVAATVSGRSRGGAVLRLWDVAGGAEIARLALPGVPYAVDLSPDGKVALVSEQTILRYLDMTKLGRGESGRPASWRLIAGGEPPPKEKPAAGPKPEEKPKEKPAAAEKTKEKPATAEKPFAGHKGAVLSIAYSPDGKFLLAGGEDGTTLLYDAKTGARVRAFPGKDAVGCVRFSGDGRRLLVLAGAGAGQVFDAARGDRLYSFPFDPVPAPASGDLSADGLGAVVAVNRMLTAVRGNTNDKPATWVSAHYPSRVVCARYAEDGSFYAFGDSLGVVRVYDTIQDKAAAQWAAHAGAVLCLAVGGGKTPRVASGGADKVILVRAGKQRAGGRKLTGHDGAVTGLSFSANGKRLASCAKDRTVRVWDVTTGKPLHKFVTQKAVLGVALAPDGKTLACCGADGVVVHALPASRP